MPLKDVFDQEDDDVAAISATVGFGSNPIAGLPAILRRKCVLFS